MIRFEHGRFYPLLVGLVIFGMAGGPALLFLKYLKFKGIKKQQTLYVLIGFLLTAIFGIVTNVFLQDKISVGVFRLGNYGAIFLIVFTSYAIMRHQLFDIRIVIQRGIIYSTMLGIIVGLYIMLVFIFGFFFQQATDATILWAAGITTIAGIYGVPYLEKYFRKITDKFFFKDKYDYSEAMHALSEILNKNINLEVLLKEIMVKLKEILKVGRVYILLPKQKKIIDQYGILRPAREPLSDEIIKEIEVSDFEIFSHSEISCILKDETIPNKSKDIFKKVDYFGKKYGIELSVPIRLGNKLVGIIALGEKLSGDLYTNDDFTLLNTISYQTAVAMEKARLYEQVKNYTQELEKKVEKRTAEIKDLQEEQKQMMLEIAHGLQTPLTIIKSELSIMEKEKKDDPNVSSLRKTINRTSKFIYDMLRLARLESEGRNFKKEKINLSEVLKSLVEEFKIITAERNIKINHEIEPGIIIFGNKSSLEELVANLVSNSVKYLEDSKNREIAINLTKDGNHIELIIADTGIGIMREDLEHLFERFYRAKDGRGSEKGGTGLGLAISKKIVEMHGGKINVESKVGKGTKFIIEFSNL